MEPTLVKSRNEITPHSLALQFRWEREVNRLRDTFKRRLQRDLLKLFEERSFTNVTFVTDDEVKIESHSAILKARVPRFYRFCIQFCQLSKHHSAISIKLCGVNGLELHNFLRQVYCGESMESSENSVLHLLRSAVGETERPANIDEEVVETDVKDVDDNKMELENMDQYKCLASKSENDLAKEKFHGENEALLDLSLGKPDDDDDDGDKLLHEITVGDSDVLSSVNLNRDTDAVDIDVKFSGELDDAVLDYQNEIPVGAGYVEGEHDLIVFDESECEQAASFVDTHTLENQVDILDLDVDDTESLALTQKTEDTQMVGTTRSDADRSETEGTLMSSLKTSAELEGLDLRLVSKDGQLMIHSHDSGMCSDSRMLSMSSVGQPTFSPSSENVADSSNESLPKDDSLECCLDSLANDEMVESSTSLFGDPESVGTSSQNVNVPASHNVESHTNQMSASFPTTGGGELSSWKSVFAKRYSWLDVDEENVTRAGHSVPPRRWSLSSVESEQKTSATKPAAVVPPYNANVDLQLVLKPSDASDSSPALADNILPEAVRTPDTRGPMSIVSFVPFLREEHHIQERNVAEINLALLHRAGLMNADVSSEQVPNLVLVEDVRSDTDEASHEMRPDVDESDAASDVFSQPIADSDVSTGLASVNVCLTPADKVEMPSASTESISSHPPPPVYMFIEATECQSPSHIRPRSVATKGHPKVGEFTSREVPLRRKVLGAAGLSRRPKSETSASLFHQLDFGRRNRSSDKRVSLTLDDDNDDVESTRSLEVPVTMSRLTGGSCSKLGDDLLKMFLNEIDPDVTVIVNGKQIKAHKSVLSSRCVYFAAAMSGNWVESSGNVINMSGFSYEAVHFALYHIYSGASAIPENIDISELASLADMLGFEGLKDVVALALKMKYCHFFHKPCAGCAVTVSECLLISASFGLDDLQEKCLRWINKYFLKTWPTKSFAALPDELLQKCLAASKIDISTESVLDLIVRCDKLAATLPRVKWVEPVTSLTHQLAETCALYLSENLADVLGSRSFMDLRTGHTWSIHALESSLLIAAENTSLNGACKSYVRLHALKNIYYERESTESHTPEVNENFDLLVTKIHRQVEHFLIHNANRVVRCPGWALLSSDLQQRIKDAAVIVFEFGKPTAAPPKLSSQNKKFTRARTSCSSTASGSPVVWNNRVGVNSKLLSKSLHLTLEDKSSNRNGRNADKAATLPRASAVKVASGLRKEESESHSNKLKSVQSNKPLSNNASHGKLQSQVNQPCLSGIQRPKPVNLKERSSSVTATKVRDKPVTRELSHSSKSLIPNSISLRTASGISSKVSVNHRPKSTISSGGARSAKSPAHCCPNGNELCGKENKDEIKNLSSRTRADETARPGLRKIGPRTSLTRAGCSSTVKV